MSKAAKEAEDYLESFNRFLKKMYDIENLDGTPMVKNSELQYIFENCLFHSFLAGIEHSKAKQQTEKG